MWNSRVGIQEGIESGSGRYFLSHLCFSLYVCLILPTLHADFLQNKGIHRAVRFSRVTYSYMHIFILCYILYIVFMYYVCTRGPVYKFMHK